MNADLCFLAESIKILLKKKMQSVEIDEKLAAEKNFLAAKFFSSKFGYHKIMEENKKEAAELPHQN